MIQAKQIAEALPNFSKADKLLNKFLKERAIPKESRDPCFSFERYFNNSKTNFLCVKTGFLVEVVKELKKKKQMPELTIFLDNLWNSNIFEKMIIAGKLAEFVDLSFTDYEQMVKRIDNWAHCDVLCSRAIAFYFLEHQNELPKLKKWAKSKNRWYRRAATVSLMRVLDDKNASKKEALKILDILMEDSDDMVMKATDWMIRTLSSKHQDMGYEYCKKWALRYKKTGNKNIRWVLVRARHKLNEKHKQSIEKLLSG
jgi:3-methyladenine DNA glycosylase AlkD